VKNGSNIVYFGENTISNAHIDVECSISSRLTLSENENSIFEEIKRAIY
jgi:hypothetical protein